jgi:hypothetical protein
MDTYLQQEAWFPEAVGLQLHPISWERGVLTSRAHTAASQTCEWLVCSDEPPSGTLGRAPLRVSLA